jgi:23S rRNA (cytosine1962-C5)-methyltransferase
MERIVLTGRGRRRFEGGHPWIYRDDVAKGDCEPGGLVSVLAPGGEELGYGLYSSASKIAVRLVTRPGERPRAPDRDFWRARLAAALERRRRLGYLDPEGACRLIHGDAEGLPGLVADRYADALVLQSGCQGADRLCELVVELLDELLDRPARHVLERSDASVRRLRGGLAEPLCVRERPRGAAELCYEVDLLSGHKTGHYLDQRENRLAAAAHAGGGRVLDAFSYDGLFGIRAALAGAAEVLCIDQSAGALERLARNAERNGVAGRVRAERANAMQDLRQRVQAGERYDLVIVDPPAFAKNRREVAGAARGYRELNLRALRLLAPGGTLVTCSCSYNTKAADFLEYAAEASRDAGVAAWVLETRAAAADHPALLTLPESQYLKCLVLAT